MIKTIVNLKTFHHEKESHASISFCCTASWNWLIQAAGSVVMIFAVIGALPDSGGVDLVPHRRKSSRKGGDGACRNRSDTGASSMGGGICAADRPDRKNIDAICG